MRSLTTDNVDIEIQGGDGLVRWLFILLWGSMILLLTSVSDFSSLMQAMPKETIIDWDFQPNYWQIYELPRILTKGYILQKLGHIVCFFILASMMRTSTYKVRFGLILFALTTEMLQLFTGRSGRLLDVGYDIIGIYLGLMFVKKPERVKQAYQATTYKRSL